MNADERTKFDAMWTAMGDYLNGRTVQLDGRRGRIHVRRYMAKYPYRHMVETITHEPTNARPSEPCITDLAADETGRIFAIAKRRGFDFTAYGFNF